MQLLHSSEEIKDYIHQRLQTYNIPYMNEYRDFSYHIEDAGSIIAGIVAESVSDTIEIHYLYVEEAHRNKGLGRLLLSTLEENGRKSGMKRILLNTYSFQAPEFYNKCGYKELFEINPCFGPHSQFYYVKTLDTVIP